MKAMLLQKRAKFEATLYHGQHHDDDALGGTASGGHYFTDDPQYADSYGNVRLYQIKLNKPLDLHKALDNDAKGWLKVLKAAGLNTTNVKLDSSLTDMSLLPYSAESYRVVDDGRDHPLAKNPELLGKWVFSSTFLIDPTENWRGDGNLLEEIKRQGFDGLLLPGESDESKITVVTFYPESVKVVPDSRKDQMYHNKNNTPVIDTPLVTKTKPKSK